MRVADHGLHGLGGPVPVRSFVSEQLETPLYAARPLCGSRATALAILASALASPIDEFLRLRMDSNRGTRLISGVAG